MMKALQVKYSPTRAWRGKRRTAAWLPRRAWKKSPVLTSVFMLWFLGIGSIFVLMAATGVLALGLGSLFGLL